MEININDFERIKEKVRKLIEKLKKFFVLILKKKLLLHITD